MPPGATLDFNIKAWKSGGVSRPASKRHDFGLEFEQRDDGYFYMTKCDGLVKDFTDFKVGDRLYKFQDKPANEWTLEELQQTIKDSLKLSLECLNPEKMKEKVKVQDLPVEKGDVVPLKDYKEKPELNGKDVEILRKLNSGKYLVTPVGKMKEKLLIDASNLHLEIQTEKLTLKELSDDEETIDEEEEGGEGEGEEEDGDDDGNGEEIPNNNNNQEEKGDEKTGIDENGGPEESVEAPPQAGSLEEPEATPPDDGDDKNGNDDEKKIEQEEVKTQEEEVEEEPDVSAGVEKQEEEEVGGGGDDAAADGGGDDDELVDDTADKEE